MIQVLLDSMPGDQNCTHETIYNNSMNLTGWANTGWFDPLVKLNGCQDNLGQYKHIKVYHILYNN
jgi:hypothetical protein